MSDMRISSEASFSASFARSVHEKTTLQPGKVIAPRMVQTPHEMGKALHKLGDFLKNALLELRALATGSETPSAEQAKPVYATSEAAHAAQSASEFLRLHEAQQAH